MYNFFIFKRKGTKELGVKSEALGVFPLILIFFRFKSSKKDVLQTLLPHWLCKNIHKFLQYSAFFSTFATK